jgi:hypothetical protein
MESPAPALLTSPPPTGATPSANAAAASAARASQSIDELLQRATASRARAESVLHASASTLSALALRLAMVVALLGALLAAAAAAYAVAYVSLVPRTKVSVPLFFDFDRAVLAPAARGERVAGDGVDACAAPGDPDAARRLEALDAGAAERRQRSRVVYPTARADLRLARQQWHANASMLWGVRGAEPLVSRSGRLLHPAHSYDVYLVLELPPSAANVDAGVSMASLELRSAEELLLASSERSWMLPFRSALQRRARDLTFLLPALLGFDSGSEAVEVHMLNAFVEPAARASSASIAVVRLSDSRVQVASASLQFRVRLSGVVALMTWWPVTAAVLGIGGLWAALAAGSALAWLARVARADDGRGVGAAAHAAL